MLQSFRVKQVFFFLRMRAKASLLLGIFFFICVTNLSYSQKLSEEDALEGSANLMSPDDEDFNEHSGDGELPPEVDHKSSTFKPHFVTQPNVNEIIKETVGTDAPTTVVTSKPTKDAESADSNHTMLIVAIGVIVAVLILLVLVIVCCRKKKTDYEPGTQRV
jgi:sensor c-di-GMP phosphodiesterase-like protein